MQSTISLVETRARELEVVSRAVIATDPDGQVVYWNDAAERLYGWTSDEAFGRSITELTPTTHSQYDAARIMDSLRRGQHWSGEFPVRRKDGRTFVAHVIDAPVHDETGTLVGIIGISDDVSPLVRLLRLARELSGAVTAEAVARVSLEAALEVSGAAGGWLMALAEGQTHLEVLHSAGYDDDLVRRFRRVALDAPLPIAVAARNGEPLFITSADEWRERFPSTADATDPRTRTWIALPLKIANRVVGALGLSVRIARGFSEQDREVLVALSQHAAVALDRALLFGAEHAARREAEDARSRAEEANRVKSTFLAMMSHELRTPLGAIIGYSDLLAERIFGPLTAGQDEHLRRLRGSATHLLSVIDELLSFSRLEAGREVVAPETGSLGQLLDSVFDIVAPLARGKGLEFHVDSAARDGRIRTDLQKVRQILVNLAGNAIKYTERGSVAITARLDDGMLRVRVSDTGIGIAPEHLAQVFDPFWQVQSQKARKSGGTGLGLSVSRSMARLLGGDVTVTSEPNAGSVFTLEVPVGTT